MLYSKTDSQQLCYLTVPFKELPFYYVISFVSRSFIDKLDLLYRLSYWFTKSDVILNEFTIENNVLASQFESLQKFVDLCIGILILHHQPHYTVIPVILVLVLLLIWPITLLVVDAVMHLNQ